ncbi:MAG: hypothetical protein IPP47_19670 [Bryobacterales bacterium]|nr:hypothetical protein [Bryobacterales bacterium]
MFKPAGWVFGAVVVVLCGCGNQRPHDFYDFDFGKPVDYPQLIFRSSTILVGTVRSVVCIQNGVPARRQPELLLDQMRVSLDVENVLRGNVRQSRLEFDFFTYSLSNKGGYTGPGRYRVEAGERRIFFLTWDDGVYRSAADVRGDYSLRVWSGLHRNFVRSEPPDEENFFHSDSAGVGNDIATILLQLGEDYSREAMIGWLEMQQYVASVVSGRVRTAGLLRQLAANSAELELSAAACLILAGQFPGQDACLAKYAEDQLLPAELRRKVREMVAGRDERKLNVIRWAKRHPVFGGFIAGSKMTPFPDSVAGLQAELTLMLDDSDREMRLLACEGLRQLAEPEPRCQAGGRW